MDPTAVWNRIKAALIDGDTIEAIDASIDLSIWLNGGGFMPTGITIPANVTTEQHVWSVLSFFGELDPDDELRNQETTEADRE